MPLGPLLRSRGRARPGAVAVTTRGRVDIGGLIGGTHTFDLLFFLVLFASFVLGFMQGNIRRLLGTPSMVFAFFLAANVKVPLGDFLGREWDQFSPQYGEMIGFLTVFAAAVIATSLVIQGTYAKTSLFEKYEFLDEIIGGALGVFQAVMFLTFLTIVLDSFFLLNIAKDADELPFLRSFWESLNASATGDILHHTIIPRLVEIVGLLLPDSVKVLYGG
jgi:uncharacterized membrane protein required for colicin V production